MTPLFTATLLVLACVALWALIPVVAKLGQTTLDNHQFLFWSSLVSCLILSIAAFVRGRFTDLRSYTAKDWLKITALGLLGTYIYYLLLYLGYARAVGMEVLVFQYTWPLLVVLLSLLMLRERVTVRKIVALTLGCVGVTALYFLVATGASLISMLMFSSWAIPASAEITPILVNGVFVNGFSCVLWLMALRRADASYLAPFVFVTPVLSAFYLILFFKEPVSLAHGVGLACIIAAGLTNSLRPHEFRS